MLNVVLQLVGVDFICCYIWVPSKVKPRLSEIQYIVYTEVYTVLKFKLISEISWVIYLNFPFVTYMFSTYFDAPSAPRWFEITYETMSEW